MLGWLQVDGIVQQGTIIDHLGSLTANSNRAKAALGCYEVSHRAQTIAGAVQSLAKDFTDRGGQTKALLETALPQRQLSAVARAPGRSTLPLHLRAQPWVLPGYFCIFGMLSLCLTLTASSTLDYPLPCCGLLPPSLALF